MRIFSKEWWTEGGSGRGVDFEAGAVPRESNARAVAIETDRRTTRFGELPEVPVIQGYTTDPVTGTIEPAYSCKDKYRNIEVNSGRAPKAAPYQIDRSNEGTDW